MDTFIARQPIFDQHREVFGYELLFRSGPENCFAIDTDGDKATSMLVTDTMGVHGLSELTSGKMAFVNVTEKILVNELYSVLPPERTVIELLETVPLTDEVCEACRGARRKGYPLALDDYIGDPRFDPILHDLDILKIDFQDTTPSQRQKIAQKLKGTGVKLLAEKVETHEEFHEAIRLGCAYLQGYFFCEPEIIKGRDLPSFKINYLQFLQQMNQPDLNLDELEQIILHDVSLSYRLLKMLNSAAIGVRYKVESIKHAMVLLGDGPLRKWASLIALAHLGADKPHELLATSLLRGRFCESLAGPAGWTGRELDMFLLGLFSVLAAMVDQPLDAVLEKLTLRPDVSDTLVGETTPLTPLYKLAVVFDRGKWEEIDALCAQLSIEGAHVGEKYQEAILWAQSIMSGQQAETIKTAS